MPPLFVPLNAYSREAWLQLQRDRFHTRRIDGDVLNEHRVSSKQNQEISTDSACLRLGSHDPGAARPHVRRTCGHWIRWQGMRAELVLEEVAGLKSLDGMGVSIGGGQARWSPLRSPPPHGNVRAHAT